MRRRRHRQKKKEAAFFTKHEAPVVPNNTKQPNTQVVSPLTTKTMEHTKKHHSGNWGNAVKVADIFADYINPAIYVMFSVVYFINGIIISYY